MKKQIIIIRDDVPALTGDNMKYMHSLLSNGYNNAFHAARSQDHFEEAIRYAKKAGMAEGTDFQVVNNQCMVFVPMELERFDGFLGRFHKMQEFSAVRRAADG